MRLRRWVGAVLICTASLIAPHAQSQSPLDAALVRDSARLVATTVAAEYFDAGVGAQAAARVTEQAATGRYTSLRTNDELASAITRDLFAVTQDKHLVVSVVGRGAGGGTPTAPVESRAARGRRENFGVRKAAILDGNVGYLDLTSFYRADEAREAIGEAMRTLAPARALIIDLRDNGGGAPDTVALLAGYLFDAPSKALFDIVPRAGDSQLYTTPSPVVEPRDGSRPCYLLTSARTFSAGEGFAFLLQELHRAVVVGERTAGAANPGRAYPAGDAFEVVVPNGQVRTTVSGRNWEGVGVTPDVPTSAAQALVRAQELAGSGGASALQPQRLAQNPLITVASSPTLGNNVNGPTVIRVPDWVEHPLGRYYMYFANHMGDFVRLAWANAPTGPWTIYDPGVLHVRDTAFFRQQPDAVETLDDFYTHVASPEILIDPERRRFVMWVHGWWTGGERWPSNPVAARAWARQHGYGQFTQPAESTDGVHFIVRESITKTSYLRVFQHGSYYYGVSRLGLVSRSTDPLAPFEAGPNLFRESSYAGRVRHVALVQRGERMYVFFTGIGDAPERVLVSTVDLSSDWTMWRAAAPVEVLRPEAAYECVNLPNAPSEAGDINEPARQLRDPFVFEDAGKTYLFYASCGEQGIAAAEIRLPTQ